MQNKYKIIIIGGGAGGLLCAIELATGGKISGSDVLIIEKNDRVAKKIVATGNGQGNISNVNISVENYYGKEDFVKTTVDNIYDVNLIEYFKKMGLCTVSQENGKIYPLSKQASSICDVLRAHLEKLKINLKLSQTVNKIVKGNNGYTVKTDKEEFFCEYLVIAVGGSTAKQFGTDGKSYSLALNLGHKLTELTPSLVQIKTELDKIRGLKGLKEEALVTARDGEKELKKITGDLLFTDFGVSGSAIFGVSGLLLKAKKPNIKIEFLPQFSLNEVEEILKNNKKYLPNYAENPFSGVINKKIGERVYKFSQDKSERGLALALKNFVLNVTGSLGFDYAQVTKGGIDTDGIDPKNYQSKINKNLYLIGEMIDIDGDCGGYNLTFAFVSGIVSARDIKKKQGIVNRYD